MNQEEEKMLLGTKGQTCHNLEEAEGYIREFIAATLADENGAMKRHSGEYDLYLPWLQEDVFTAPRPNGDNPRIPDLDRLFMDAAWSLVTKGYLRPGAHKISSVVSATDYGRGFSLTHRGHQWVRE